MALTKADVEKKLKDQQLDYTTKGNTITVQTSGDRTQLLKSLAKSIPGRFKDDSTRSSIGEVLVGAVHVIVKKGKKVGESASAGSGAGAYITALAESAQCYYCAAAWYQNDFSDKSLRKAAEHVNATSSVDTVISELTEEWITSCTKTAKALHSKYGTKRLKFHRGSSVVNSINANFSAINKDIKFFSNLNKWSPADMWMFSDEGLKTSWNFKTFQSINHFLLDAEKKKNVIGVSLKKTESANVDKINFSIRDRKTYVYSGHTLGKTGFFASGDVYIFFDSDGEIQFRNFAPTWQAEIGVKNGKAKHGKISSGPLKTLVRKHVKNAQMDSQATIKAYVKSKSKTFYRKWHTMYTAMGQPKMSLKDFTAECMSKSADWQAAKFLGTQLLYILDQPQNSAKRQAVVSSLVNYAKSQSEYSAPHIKVH